MKKPKEISEISGVQFRWKPEVLSILTQCAQKHGRQSVHIFAREIVKSWIACITPPAARKQLGLPGEYNYPDLIREAIDAYKSSHAPKTSMRRTRAKRPSRSTGSQ
jgi:hypothetical protein